MFMNDNLFDIKSIEELDKKIAYLLSQLNYLQGLIFYF